VRGQVLPQGGHIVPRPGLDLIAMDFPKRLATLRNERGMTQGTLAEHVGIHVSQLRRYEAGNSSPTLDVLRKLAIALSVSSDTLVFDAERDSDEELRLQLEATQRLTDEDRQLVKRFINGLLLSHEAKRLAA
jgi:transcriptional regulator with XRE-family HTH domain